MVCQPMSIRTTIEIREIKFSFLVLSLVLVDKSEIILVYGLIYVLYRVCKFSCTLYFVNVNL